MVDRDKISGIARDNIHIIFFIAGFILLVPVAFLARQMIDPPPDVIDESFGTVIGLVVYVKVTVMPWIALFFIALINGVYLIIIAMIYSSRAFRKNPDRITDGIPMVKKLIGVTTALIIVLFFGVVVLNYILRALPGYATSILYVLAVILLFGDRLLVAKRVRLPGDDDMRFIALLALFALTWLSDTFVIAY